MGDIEEVPPCLNPHVAFYGPCNVRNLENGQVKLWCTCGLSQKQPWCDGSHKGTKFKPMKWEVPGTLADGKAQSLYQLCACKYTQSPPYCDATHADLPMTVKKNQRECQKPHEIDGKPVKICENCGWAPKVVEPEPQSN